MKLKFGLGLMGLLLFPFAASAITEVSYDKSVEFGECYADPIYEEAFIGKTLVNAKLRAVACMNNSKVLSVLPANTKVKVVAKTDGWYKVKTQDGKSGWMGSWIVAKTTDTSFTEVKKEAVVKKETVKTTVNFGTLVSELSKLSLKDLYSLRDKILVKITELEKQEAKKKEEAAAVAATSQVNSVSGPINLTGSVVGNSIKLNWTTDIYSKYGFKVVGSKTENPVYPGNQYHYYEEGVRSDEWNLPAGEYYFRVCEYLGGKCGIYSNNFKAVVVE